MSVPLWSHECPSVVTRVLCVWSQAHSTPWTWLYPNPAQSLLGIIQGEPHPSSQGQRGTQPSQSQGQALPLPGAALGCTDGQGSPSSQSCSCCPLPMGCGSPQEGLGQGVFNWGSPSAATPMSPTRAQVTHPTCPLLFPTNQRVSCTSLCSASPTAPQGVPGLSQTGGTGGWDGIGRWDGMEQDGVKQDGMGQGRWDIVGYSGTG